MLNDKLEQITHKNEYLQLISDKLGMSMLLVK